MKREQNKRDNTLKIFEWGDPAKKVKRINLSHKSIAVCLCLPVHGFHQTDQADVNTEEWQGILRWTKLSVKNGSNIRRGSTVTTHQCCRLHRNDAVSSCPCWFVCVFLNILTKRYSRQLTSQLFPIDIQVHSILGSSLWHYPEVVWYSRSIWFACTAAKVRRPFVFEGNTWTFTPLTADVRLVVRQPADGIINWRKPPSNSIREHGVLFME